MSAFTSVYNGNVLEYNGTASLFLMYDIKRRQKLRPAVDLLVQNLPIFYMCLEQQTWRADSALNLAKVMDF